MVKIKKIATRTDGLNLEGIGSILQGILHLYAFCKINNLEFVCKKLNGISHFQYTNYDSNQFSEKLNNFFNLHTKNYDFDEFVDPNWLISSWGEEFNNQKKTYIGELFNKINYQGVKLFDYTKKSLVIHIRNVNDQDVCFDSRREYFSDIKKKYYVKLLENILKSEIKEFDIHIFSQGKYEDFEVFKQNYGAKIHLNNDIIETLYHMMTCNYFVTSNSSFSWISHLYGQNEKVYSRNNFFHSWYPETILVDYNGDFI